MENFIFCAVKMDRNSSKPNNDGEKTLIVGDYINKNVQ